jgi:glycosyltransferase involved in cell wall biosynthesis
VRLLLCIPYFAPAYAFGGSVTVAETVVEDLLAAGHAVTVATTDVLTETARIAPGTPAQPAGAEVVRFRNVSHRAAVGAAYAPRGMRAWMRANASRFDVVLLQDVYSAVSVLGARGAARAGVPYALQPLGTLSTAPERGRPLAKRAFLRLWANRTVAEAAALVYCADHERADLAQAGGTPAQLVRMALPLELPDVSRAGAAAVPTVAFVGRLHPIKRIDRLIEAVALARREVPELVLEIVGPGDRHGAELEALAARLGIADAVRFRGYVSVQEKLAILARAHVSVLLSASEGLPMAALEAMACATPVVLSEGCHLSEVHDRGGIVVPGGAQDAADAIVELLGDPARRARLAAGAAVFAHDFRREVVMPQMIAMLEAVAAAAPRGTATVPR